MVVESFRIHTGHVNRRACLGIALRAVSASPSKTSQFYRMATNSNMAGLTWEHDPRQNFRGAWGSSCTFGRERVSDAARVPRSEPSRENNRNFKGYCSQGGLAGRHADGKRGELVKEAEPLFRRDDMPVTRESPRWPRDRIRLANSPRPIGVNHVAVGSDVGA